MNYYHTHFRKLFFLFIILFQTIFSFAQNAAPAEKHGGGGMMKKLMIGHFYGKVVDAKTNDALEFTSVQLWKTAMDTVAHQPKEVLAGGMLTDNHGEFSLENLPLFGNYTLKISALGYTPYEQKIKFDA